MLTHKQDEEEEEEEEANKVNIDQQQEATHLSEIQWQVEMYSYTGTLHAFHATVMDTFPINSQINNQNQLILQWLELFWFKMATWIRKHEYFWTIAL